MITSPEATQGNMLSPVTRNTLSTGQNWMNNFEFWRVGGYDGLGGNVFAVPKKFSKLVQLG